MVGPASAQFSDFATTGDGSTLYFSSTLVLKGTGAPEQGRIFAVDSSGLRTAMEPTADYYDLSRPQVSRDGSILAVRGRRDCLNSGHCYSEAVYQTIITGGPGGDRNITGASRMSGNGRYLLIYDDGALLEIQLSVMDLQTGASQTYPVYEPERGNFFSAGRVVADDGTAVVPDCLLRGGEVTSLPFSFEPSIDAAGSTVVYTGYGPSLRSAIRIYRIADGRDVVLAAPTAASMSVAAPIISADGARVMFLLSASGVKQIWTVNSDGAALRQVTHDASGVQQATMSDDGRVAWYLSGSGHVLRINLDTGESEDRVGRTMQFGFANPPLVPGSAVTISGTGFSDAFFSAGSFPLPRSLGGVSVTVGGMDAPIISVAPTAVTLQVPWEVPVGGASSVALDLQTGATSSPFAVGSTLSSSPTRVAWGTFVPNPASPSNYGGLDVRAVHGDWSAIVSPDYPARPGELIHIYGTGFGRVDAPPPTGMASPANPLARTVVPVTCWTWGADNISQVDIPVLYSGLAPGLAGYYQLDIRLPGGNLRTAFQFYCNGEQFRGPMYSGDFYGSFAVSNIRPHRYRGR